MRPISRSLQVVITVNAGAATQGATIKFPDVPELRETGVLCYGFQTCNADTQAFTLDGNPVITADDSLNVLFTLVEKSNQRFQRIPFQLFDQVATKGIWFETTPMVWEPQQSWINFTATAALGATFSVPMVVHFSKPIDRAREMR